MRRISATALVVMTFWAVDARAQTFTTLDVPGAASTGASGIDNNGRISGQYYDSNGVSHGFFYNGGIFATIDVPSSIYTDAFGVNNSGPIAGAYAVGSTTAPAAFSVTAAASQLSTIPAPL